MNKKGNEQLVINYHHVSLLPICSKIFEKLIFDFIYDFLDLSYFLNINQSGFRPGDSDIHQLIAVSHNIFTTFDANPSLDVCSDFRDFSKPLIEFGIRLLRKLKNN